MIWTAESALVFWNIIAKYADAKAELWAEGNSGEFHDARKAEELSRAFDDANENMLAAFVELTGFEPVEMTREWEQYWTVNPVVLAQPDPEAVQSETERAT